MRRITATTTAPLTALALAGLTGLTGCAVELDAKEVHAAQSFPYTGPRLTIKSSLGGLRIMPGTGTTVQVERWLRGKAAQDGNASWSLRDGTLRLSANCTVVFGDCGARYHIKVPPGIHLAVDGEDDGIILQSLTQDVDVANGGSIKAYDTSGKLRLLSDDATITGERLKSPTVRVRSNTGAINLSFAAPPSSLDLLSKDGRVTATVPAGAYQVTVRSRDGAERSEIKSTKSDRTIVAKSNTGDVRIIAR
ncbi:hypothetical protein [Nonomuraea sp. NEAU-A123]|uniref:hypothetical protein n=1 Tax=Nonomuraea sp. NEAU-A123 TaxID=2839649 RepID=UPI001BE407C0|nr:hypothetical protein [Nonomuraea sp. NEAU-A123]MBT2224576.1 hypothetical protein [Nonomuraea sp. NEAU-A123]